MQRHCQPAVDLADDDVVGPWRSACRS